MSVEKFTEEAYSLLEAEFEREILKPLEQDITQDHWTSVSNSPKLTIGIITRHPELPWVWRSIAKLSCLTFDFVMEHLAEFLPLASENEDALLRLLVTPPWAYISANKNITWEHITQHPELPWMWYGISKNPSITMDLVLQNMGFPWDWGNLSTNPSGTLTLEMVLANRDKKWNWSTLSQCLPLSEEILDQHPDLPWNWCLVSANKNFTPEFWNSRIASYDAERHSAPILTPTPTTNTPFATICRWVGSLWTGAATPSTRTPRPTTTQRNWTYKYYLGSNPSMPIQTIVDNPRLPWDWQSISRRKDVTWELVQKNLDLPWNWRALSQNNTITWEIVQANPNISWCRNTLASNPNITYNHVREVVENKTGAEVEVLMTHFSLYNRGLTHLDFDKICLPDMYRYILIFNTMESGYKKFVDTYVSKQLAREIELKWLRKVAEKYPRVDMRLFDKIGEYL